MSDTPVYVLLADYFSPYYASADWFGVLFAQKPFPPLYPMWLGLLGGGSRWVLWTHLLGAGTVALCAAAYAAWLTQRSCSLPLALLHALVFAVLPVTLFTAMDTLSEHLYLLLSLLGMLLIGTRRRNSLHWCAAGIVFGLAAIVRTAGVTGIAAFVVYWLLQTRGRRYRAAPFLALLPTLVWAAVKSYHGFDTSYVMSVVADPPIDTLPALVAAAPANITALWTHGVDGIDVLQSPLVASVLPLALAFACAGLLLGLRRGHFDALYCAMYCGLLALWPHHDHAGRFLFSVTPLLLFYMTSAAAHLGLRVRAERDRAAVRVLPLALVAALALPSSLTIVYQVTAHHGTAHGAYARTSVWFRQGSFAAAERTAGIIAQMFGAIRSLARRVEPGACITSVYPYYTMLLTQRPSQFPEPAGSTQSAFERTLGRCAYVLILNATNDTFGFADQYYPYDRIRGSIRIVGDVYYEGVASEPVVAAILARHSAGGDTLEKSPGGG